MAPCGRWQGCHMTFRTGFGDKDCSFWVSGCMLMVGRDGDNAISYDFTLPEECISVPFYLLTWRSRVCHVGITWLSRGDHVVVTWLSRGCHAGITWLSRGCHVVLLWLVTWHPEPGVSCPKPLVEYPLLAALPEEGLHALNTWWRGAALPVPLKLVHVLPEHVSGSQGADQIVELGLVLTIWSAAKIKFKKYLSRSIRASV